MKELLLILLLFVGVKVKSQDTSKKDGTTLYQYNLVSELMKDRGRLKEKHRIIDSLCLSIDKNKETYKLLIDTAKVTDINDPSKIVDLVFWKFYYTRARQLKMVVMLEDHKRMKTAYYFKDTSVIKITQVDPSKKKNDKFYYDESDNAKSDSEIKELAKTADQREFYRLLIEAKADYTYFKTDTERFK